MSKKQELATQGTTALAVQNRRGFETESGREDLLIPRTKLIQPLSPEVEENGIKAGSIVNSLTKEVLPSVFVPVFVFKEYIRFNTRATDKPGYDPNYPLGALMWKTADALDPRVEETKFGPNGEQPVAQAVLNFFSWFPGCDMPIIVSFAKTSYKAGKQLYSLTKFCQGDMFSRKYSLTTKKEQNDSGSYWVYQVAPAGLASEEEYKTAEAFWQQFSSKAQELNAHEVEPETV
jgi:hypothetical protein